jgi:hypothetical protein
LATVTIYHGCTPKVTGLFSQEDSEGAKKPREEEWRYNLLEKVVFLDLKQTAVEQK